MKPGQYCIQFKKGDLKPQTRMSIVADLARVLLQGERERFPELGTIDEELAKFEQHMFVLELFGTAAYATAGAGRARFTSQHGG